MAYIAGEQRRAAILQYVKDYWLVEGVAPTVREVMRGCGYRSPAAANYQIGLLVAAGLLQHRPKTPRTLRVVER